MVVVADIFALYMQLHVRGGSIIPMQLGPGLTTTETRKNPYSLLVALAGGNAAGYLYVDDGETYNTTEWAVYFTASE